MPKSQSEVASECRRRAEHYRELAAATTHPEMRATFLQAVAACEHAAALAEMKAIENGERGTRR
ncbi:MAG: hypothetical protein ACM30I_01770 [Gemmatimonas sp.]